MEPAPTLKAVLLAGLILASAFFSSAESALFSLGIYRVRRLKDRSLLGFQAAQKLLREPTKLISTILVGNELVNTAIGVIGSSLVYDVFSGKIAGHYLALTATAIVLPLVVIFGEIIPKTLGVKLPERTAGALAIPLDWFSTMIAPVRNSLSWISDRLLALTGAPTSSGMEVSKEVFRSMVEAGTEEGVLEAHEKKLINNVFRLDNIQIHQIMSPRKDLTYLTSESTVRDALQKFESERFSRFPVLSKDEKDVIGVVYLKDLLSAQKGKGADSALKPYIRDALVVPATMNALDLLVQFRSRRMHFALVAEPTSGDLMGVVTLDDVLKEIFGRLRDERDVEEEPSKR